MIPRRSRCSRLRAYSDHSASSSWRGARVSSSTATACSGQYASTPPRCGPPGRRRSTFQTGSGRPCSWTIRYSRSSAIARPSASSESTASTTCGLPSSFAAVNSRTTEAGSQCPARTASVSRRRTAPASVSSATASASARGTGATGSPVTSRGVGRDGVRRTRTYPAERSRRSRGTSTSTRSRAGSGGVDEKPCRVRAARPVITASAYTGRCGSSAVGWDGTPGADSRAAYSSAPCSRSSLVGGPGWSRTTFGRSSCQGPPGRQCSVTSADVTPWERSWAAVRTRRWTSERWRRGRGESGVLCVMASKFPRLVPLLTAVTRPSINADKPVLKDGCSGVE